MISQFKMQSPVQERGKPTIQGQIETTQGERLDSLEQGSWLETGFESVSLFFSLID